MNHDVLCKISYCSLRGDYQLQVITGVPLGDGGREWNGFHPDAHDPDREVDWEINEENC